MSNFTGSCQPANPDISGLGVRISFYLQTIALVLLAGRSLEEALNSVWTLLGTSFGLTISALVTAVQNELPLYQAIIVTDLVWLANWAIFMALATYNRHPRGSHIVQYAAIGQTYISMASILYLWARAGALELELGGQKGQTVFVVLFISTSAIGVGRRIALVMTTLLLIGYTVVAMLFLWRHRRSAEPEGGAHHHHKSRPRRTSNALPDALPLTRRASTPPPLSPPSAPPPMAPPPLAGGAPTRLPPSLALDPHLIILSLFIGLPYVITVGSTELQIRFNKLCPENGFWGFGQILAMTVTIVPVVVTAQAFRKYGWKQRERVPENGVADHDHTV
ncbi:hypothetical protein B0H13DRAFT_579309 [Mycena leptocephala]|nr:hypothetical protein B0H13DRAFT_579309 [Mycena leptocephala]